MFVKLAVRGVSSDAWDELADTAIRARVQKDNGGTYTNTAVEQYIELRLRSDMAITPEQIARECVTYKKLRRAMKPWAIKTAQRIKDRLRKAEKRRRDSEANTLQ